MQSVGNERVSDRRTHPRHRVLFSSIQLEGDHGGIILDVSEQGLAVQAFEELADDALLQMRFQLSESKTWIETWGRIMWTGASKKSAGVEFVALTYDARILIRRWISSTVPTNATDKENAVTGRISAMKRAPAAGEVAAAASVGETENAKLVIGSTGKSSARWSALFPSATSIDRATRKVGRWSGFLELPQLLLALGAVGLVAACVFLGYQLRKVATLRQIPQVTASTTVAATPPNTVSSPVTSPLDTKPALATSDFILQVGAMKQKGNADALVHSLQQKHFPAFILNSGSGALYLVVVGPYPSAESAQEVESELRNQNIDAIPIHRNTPTQ